MSGFSGKEPVVTQSSHLQGEKKGGWMASNSTGDDLLEYQSTKSTILKLTVCDLLRGNDVLWW